ncbi:hypothetical protein GH714_017370 [Hevea brasiliensis]|uniref:Thioredoxin domain-containing protein n=1 Tax=Hevea brasiliensis TaxID=3981 RepID=A0A6A6KSM6_HEVBR|nr:hypothetical protein GH714_017370 [Hevea brasiliensis]
MGKCWNSTNRTSIPPFPPSISSLLTSTPLGAVTVSDSLPREESLYFSGAGDDNKSKVLKIVTFPQLDAAAPVLAELKEPSYSKNSLIVYTCLFDMILEFYFIAVRQFNGATDVLILNAQMIFRRSVMVRYDFDKVPALVALHPSYNEQSIFYGPFEEKFLEDFIKQNFLPPAVPMNHDTLKILKHDERKIVLTIMEDESDEKSQKLIKLLKAAASANRDLVFGYVGLKQWEDFAETFGANKDSKLPKMVVWDGDEEYLSVIGLDSIEEEDQGSQITHFVEGYRKGQTIVKKVSGPSFMGFINSLIGIRTVYIIVFLVAMLMLIQSIGKEEPLRVGTRDQVDEVASSAAESSEYRPGDKQD